MDYMRPSERKKKVKKKPVVKETSKEGKEILTMRQGDLVLKANIESMLRMGDVFKRGDTLVWSSGDTRIEILVLDHNKYRATKNGDTPINYIVESVPLWGWYIDQARDRYEDEGTLEIDDHPNVSPSEEGAYVQAWLWVGNPEEAS